MKSERARKSEIGKYSSRLPLAVLLALSVSAGTAMFSTSAVAAKKTKNEGKEFEWSKNFATVSAPALATFKAAEEDDEVQAARAQLEFAKNSRDEQRIAAARAVMNAALADELALLEMIFEAIENEDDRFLAGALAVKLNSVAQDPEIQRPAVEAMLVSGKPKGTFLTALNAVAGYFAYRAGEYAEAHSYLGRPGVKAWVDSGSPNPGFASTGGSGNIDPGQALFFNAYFGSLADRGGNHEEARTYIMKAVNARLRTH